MGGDPEELARRAAQGDREAFEALCRRYNDDVWRYCRALLGDGEQAFDAAQETFLRAVTGIRRFRGDAPVRLWLLVLARRSVADLIRAEQRRRARVVTDDRADAVVADPTGEVDVAALIAALPEDQRQAFTLTQVVGLSYEEAAAVAGCRVGTIRSRVFRARARMVEAMGGLLPEGGA